MREEHLPTNPLEDIKGPKRPDWAPKPLELAELEQVMAAASESDPRARHSWPERDLGLLAALAGLVEVDDGSSSKGSQVIPGWDFRFDPVPLSRFKGEGPYGKLEDDVDQRR